LIVVQCKGKEKNDLAAAEIAALLNINRINRDIKEIVEIAPIINLEMEDIKVKVQIVAIIRKETNTHIAMNLIIDKIIQNTIKREEVQVLKASKHLKKSKILYYLLIYFNLEKNIDQLIEIFYD